MLSSFWEDARLGVRGLRKAPGFTAVAVLSLALGIGLNTALFTVLDAVLLRPLPIERPDELVSIFTSDESGERYATTSYPDFLDLSGATDVFAQLVGHGMMFSAMRAGDETRLAIGEVVTANYFDALGVRPQRGRGFLPEEDRGEGAHPVAVLSHRLWQRAYQGREDVIGQTIEIKRRPYTIVGVAPESFSGLMPGISSELWIPITMVEDVEPLGWNAVVPSPGDTRLQRRGTRWMQVKARLAPGVTAQAAEARAAGIMQQLAEQYPVSNRDRRPTVVAASSVRIHPMVDASMRPAAAVAMGAVGLVLLVVCANLAGMLVARGASRTREIGIRSALGATRGRIVKQLFVESVILAIAGGVAGLWLAAFATRVLLALPLPIELPIMMAITVDWRTLVFAFAASMAAAVAFGITPALGASRVDVVSALKVGLMPGGNRRGRFGLRQVLVGAQVAVSFVLIVGGLLMLRSLLASRAADPGFDLRGLAIVTTATDMQGYSEQDGQRFFERGLERIRALPGVTNAALTERMPFSPNIQTTQVVVDGRPEATPPSGVTFDVTRVSPEYFDTMGLPLLRGRNFDSRDTPESTRVAIVNEALVARLWPGESGIGRRLRVRDQSGPVIEIVGVVPTYKVRTLGEAPRPVIHFALSQRPTSAATIVARTRGDVDDLARRMQAELRAMDPSLVMMENYPMDRAVDTTLLPVRIGASLVGGVAGLAILLAGLGLYGVMAFNVGRRTREIGIRLALGARRGRVLRDVLVEGLWLVAGGAVAGLVLAVIAAQALRAALYGVGAFDPVTYLSALVLIGVAALAASLLPARRAASIDPMAALRNN